MSRSDCNDSHWNAAWEWVIREHEQRPLGDSAHAEFIAWLQADPANLKNYRRAQRIWLAAGLMPVSMPALGDTCKSAPEKK